MASSKSRYPIKRLSGGVVVIGAGGHGKVVLDILLESKVRVLGFLDDGKPAGCAVHGFRVLGPSSLLSRGMKAALGIGDNVVRAGIYERCLKAGARVVTAAHPRAIVSRFCRVGAGAVIMPGAVVNAGADLSEGVVVNTGATVDHDCRLRRFCHIWPGAHLAGTVEVGEFSYVGTGASVIQNITIGARTVIGAGAAVVRNVPGGVVAAGVPARILREVKK